MDVQGCLRTVGELQREPFAHVACISCVRSLSHVTVLTLALLACMPMATMPGSPSATAAITRVARAASEPPVVSPDGQVRFIVNTLGELVLQEASSGVTRWTLPHVLLAGREAMKWRVLVSNDGASVYAQSVTDKGTPTYLGTRRLDLRTGAELASDIKREDYWYDNVVLWMSLTAQGELQMAIARAQAAGGGYRLRTLDPQTLAVLRDVAIANRPPMP